MSPDYELSPEAQAVGERLTLDQREVMSGLLGSLSLSSMYREDLHDEVTQNIREAGGDNDFLTMDFHFVLEHLAAARVVTIDSQGQVRAGNHGESDPRAITLIPSNKPLTRQQRYLRSLQSQVIWGPSGCLDR